MTFTVGETVGPYRIASPLGQGGMATVYKAYHASLDRYVAIKVLHPAFKEDQTFLSRFQREARVLARLDHPNIVPIYDFAEHEGQPYLVMKYVEGDTLKDRLAQKPATLADTLVVLEAVGAALAYAHKQGILHRDIKPSNIIITPDNHYYLSDFGLARITSAGESTLSQDTMLGTPNYISPEQAKGQTDLDGRADIYSLGVVLYEMIVGRVPFNGDTPYSVIHDHIYTPLPLPSTLNPQVTGPMEKFLVKALAKNREDRFADVQTLLLAFRNAMGTPAGSGAGSATASSQAARTEAWPAATVVAPARAETVKAVPPIPPSVATSTPATTSSSKRIWWLAGGALLIVLCLGVIGLITLGRLTRDNRAHGTATAAAATLASVPTLKPSSASADAVANAQATSAAAPNNTEATLQLGQAYYKAARFDEATATYNKAAGLANYRAVFYMTNVIGPYTNDPIFELTVLTDGLQHANLRVQTELWTLTAPILEQAAALPNSDAVLETMVKDFPDQPLPLLALARHDVKFNRIDQAGPLIDEARRNFPDLPLTHFVNGEYLQATGKTIEAQAEFEIVVTNPRTAPALKLAAQKDIDTLKGTVTP